MPNDIISRFLIFRYYNFVFVYLMYSEDVGKKMKRKPNLHQWLGVAANDQNDKNEM